MAVKIGSARNGETGKPTNNKAGDQTGKEVSVQNWYLHSKGWRVFRCKDPAKAEKMADQMQAACDNPYIGYDQYQRHTLYKVAQAMAWELAKVKTKCETDCSALIRTIMASVGIFVPEDFRTGNMPGYLLKSGQFVELTGDKYQKQSAYLKRGDILVTGTSGHTVMVLSNGSKAGAEPAPATTAGAPVTLGSRILKKGMAGSDVKEMQTELMAQAYSLPRYGADGDFGGETLAAVKAFQADKGLDVDGEFGPKSLAALRAAKPAGKFVEVTGSLVNIRAAPGTSGRILGMVRKGERLEYQGQSQTVGDTAWYLTVYLGQNAWISGKYAEVV